MLFALILGCGENKMELHFNRFINTHLEKVKPLMKEMNTSYWNASISGEKENFAKYTALEVEWRTIYSDTNDFAQLKKIKESDHIKNPTLKRQLDLLYNAYLGNQVDPVLLKRMVVKSTAVENKFNVFRGTIKGRKVTANEIKEILKTETDNNKRRAAWLASKQVGAEVGADIIELVKIRNEAAKKLGFENYYTLSLSLTEQDINVLTTLFNELAELTTKPYITLKVEIDSVLAEKYNVAVEYLMPWHYHDPFFQEAPHVYDIDLNKYFADQNLQNLARNFYNNIGLNVDDILDRSDLYEKEGKNPHAYCIHIDRNGDVRVLANLKNNEEWMATMLHELGHGVYDKYLDFKLPFLLREPAHIFTTEAVAMLFGRLSRNANWIQQMTGISDKERDQISVALAKSLRLQQLIFARWCQVMFRFEQELYQNPDQDLNSLWWDLVEKYQKIRRPPDRNKPDWAAKIHFTCSPVYYHNYLLGELLASQIHFYLVKNVLELETDINVSYVDQVEVGDFLKNKIFALGTKFNWNEMIKNATGEYLSPRYFVHQFIR